MSARGRLVLFVASFAMLAACGEATGDEPVGEATPQAAWVDGGTTHLVQGEVEREIEGLWLPWLWLPNGDLIVHTPSDSSGMGVYRPSSGEFVTRTDDEWGRDKYDGGEYGLDSETGAVNAPDVVLRIVDGDQPADLSSGPSHSLVDYDYGLEEQARVELPAAEDAGRQRDYDFPVRVGDVTFIAFEDVRLGADLDEPDNAAGGIVRVEGDQVTVTAEAPYVQRLFLSSDAASVLAVMAEAPPEMGDTVPDGSVKSIIELDPVTGTIARDLGAPVAYEGTDWQVERVDEHDERVAAQIATECGGTGACMPQRTWVTDGTTWTEVADQSGASWFWQAGGAAVSWPASGPITWNGDTEERSLAGKKVSDRVASGSLLPPG
ncbi:MAG: hypothetical protein ABWX74_12595 [Aeromicrobium sp.]